MLNVHTRLLAVLSVSLTLVACAGTQDGQSSWSGHARHQKLSETDFIVTSITNEVAGPARLRPLIVTHAREIASSAGYSGFIVRDPSLERPRGGDGHVATAAVRLVGSKPTGEVGFEYFSASPSSTEATSLPLTEQPTLVGSTTLESSDMKGSFSPWYVDAVESTGGFFESRSLKLRPGKQLVGVYYFVCKPYFAGCRQGNVMLRVTLAAGGSYRVAGEFKNNTASAWIEDTKTGSRLQQ